MSKKHVEEYFKIVSDQYHEMLETLKELESDYATHIIEPERIDKIKATLNPIKDNYLRISYIIYLLNMPNKSKKIKKYIKQNNKQLNEEFDLNHISQENLNSLTNLKDMKMHE